jgi:hypothetical protein
VPELNLRHLDDDEAPLATEVRLDAVRDRGRVLKRRRAARLTVTAALVLVVAAGGVFGVVAKLGPRPGGVPVAGPPSTTAPLPTTDPQPTSVPSPSSGMPSPSTQPPSGRPPAMTHTYLLLPAGLDPYLVGQDVQFLRANNWITTTDGKQCQPLFSVVKPYDPNDVQLIVGGSAVKLVVVSANAKYTTSTGAYVGMSEVTLTKIYGNRLKPVTGLDGSPAGYYASTPMSIGFWMTGGKVRAMVAGVTGDVIGQIQGGYHPEC